MKILRLQRRAGLIATFCLMIVAAGQPSVAQSPVLATRPIGVLLAVGDIAECGAKDRFLNDEKVADLVERTLQDVQRQNLPVKLLLLGDLAYASGTAKEFRECFDPKWGKFKHLMLPVPGNHEYARKRKGKRSRRGKKHARPYFDYFKSEPKTLNGVPLVSSEGKRTGYYGLRFPDQIKGPWLLLGLNPYTRSKVKPHWLTWLDEKLQANERRGADRLHCILAFSHAYRFSSGWHGHNDDKKNSKAKIHDDKHIASAYGVLARYRTSLLVTAHDHHFEQFGRQNANGRKDNQGVRTFVAGTGGAGLYLQIIQKYYNTKYTIQAFNQEHLIGDKFGILKIVLFANHYSWSFLPIDGPPIYPAVNQDTCNS